MSLSAILDKLLIKPKSIEPIAGGDINTAYRITTEKHIFFLKVNALHPFADMLAKEADGLNVLREKSSLKVPLVLQNGSTNTEQFLLLEWLNKEQPAASAHFRFGEGIARLHLKTNPEFGFTENNYIGSIPQINTPTDNWPQFYAAHRILPLVKILVDRHLLSSGYLVQAEKFGATIKSIFPVEKPALLHGDLWSGNYAITTGGQVAVFDPAVYYGHREMDLGMTQLFGGFPDAFYAGYNNAYPLEKGWQKRLPYTQIYPLLIHAVLFGSGYLSRVKEILKCF